MVRVYTWYSKKRFPNAILKEFTLNFSNNNSKVFLGTMARLYTWLLIHKIETKYLEACRKTMDNICPI